MRKSITICALASIVMASWARGQDGSAPAKLVGTLGAGSFRHSGECKRVAFTPDGILIGQGPGALCGWEAGGRRLWNRDEETRSGPRPWATIVGSVVQGDDTKGIVIFDAVSGRETSTIPLGRGATFVRLGVSGDGCRIAATVVDANGSRLWTIDREHGRRLTDCECPEGEFVFVAERLLVVARPRGRLETMESDSGRRVKELGDGADESELSAAALESPARSLSCSKDGCRLCLIARDGAAVVVDVSTGKILRKLERAEGVVLSPDGELVLHGVSTNHGEPVLRVFAVADGRELWRAVGRPVQSAVFSPDSSSVAWADGGPVVRVLEARTGKLRFAPVGHTDAVTGLALDHAGKTLASADVRGAIHVWDVRGNAHLRELSPAGNEPERGLHASLAVGPDGTVAAALGGALKVWDADGREVALEGTAHGGSVAISRDGKMLVSGRVMWDLKSRKRVRELELDEAAENAVFAPDGGVLLGATRFGPDGKLLGKLLLRTPEGLRILPEIRAVAPDGTFVAIAGAPDGDDPDALALFDTTTWKRSRDLKLPPGASVRGLSDNASRVAILTDEDDVVVMDAVTGARRLVPTKKSASAVLLSADGLALAIGRDDGTITIWDAK